jgi:hypothetical protein
MAVGDRDEVADVAVLEGAAADGRLARQAAGNRLFVVALGELVSEPFLRSPPPIVPLSTSWLFTDPLRRSEPVTVPFLTLEPVKVTAAYEVPPRATNSATVAVTFV